MCNKAIEIIQSFYTDQMASLDRELAKKNANMVVAGHHSYTLGILNNLLTVIVTRERENQTNQDIAKNPVQHTTKAADDLPFSIPEACPKCGGTVGHRPNCPDGIAFTREERQRMTCDHSEEKNYTQLNHFLGDVYMCECGALYNLDDKRNFDGEQPIHIMTPAELDEAVNELVKECLTGLRGVVQHSMNETIERMTKE